MMSFRVFASGLVTVIAYQVAVAAVVVFFILHCGCAGNGLERDSAGTADAVPLQPGD